MESVKFFQVVEREWRTEYDREWGLGLVVSVDQGDGYVWVMEIGKDEDGYYLAPRCEIVNKTRLRETRYSIEDLSVKLKENKGER